MTSIIRFPKRKDRRLEEVAYLKVSYKPKKHAGVASKLLVESSLEAQKRRQDKWDEFYSYKNSVSNVVLTGDGFRSAFRAYAKAAQGKMCCYCNAGLLNNAHATPIEHVLPRKIYPQFSLYFWNLVVACSRCNGFKTASDWGGFNNNRRLYPDPTSFMFFHPRFHHYKDHVWVHRLGAVGVSVVVFYGLTPQGRHLCKNLLERVAEDEVRLGANPELQQAMTAVRDFCGASELLGLEAIRPFMEAIEDAIFD